MALGFWVEQGKTITDKIKRPVFFGENGALTLQFEVDAFHVEWRCGLEIEAGRASEGNAIYRDLIQALVMVSGAGRSQRLPAEKLGPYRNQ